MPRKRSCLPMSAATPPRKTPGPFRTSVRRCAGSEPTEMRSSGRAGGGSKTNVLNLHPVGIDDTHSRKRFPIGGSSRPIDQRARPEGKKGEPRQTSVRKGIATESSAGGSGGRSGCGPRTNVLGPLLSSKVLCCLLPEWGGNGGDFGLGKTAESCLHLFGQTVSLLVEKCLRPFQYMVAFALLLFSEKEVQRCQIPDVTGPRGQLRTARCC